MLHYPSIDPVAIHLGPIKVHWYGLTYLAAFVGCYWMLRYRAIKQPITRPLAPEEVSDWIFYGGLGVIIGGRLGYCLFYEPSLFTQFGSAFPWWGVLMIHKGGMSFHGGLLGVLAGSYLMGRRVGSTFFQMMDFLAPAAPFGLFCGRIGNFINGELWGRPTTVPWAMIFDHVDAQPRHPSMLYEAALEGLALWALLWWYSASPRPRMAVSGLFLLGYGLARFSVEFVREPDQQLGFMVADWVTMGHLLTLPMILAGLAMLWLAYRKSAGKTRGRVA